MTITREEYLKKLIARKHNGLIKVVSGIRRCGKSFLLFKLFKNHLLSEGVANENIVEIALDDDSFEQLRDPRKLSSYIREKVENLQGATYVLIDEIQMCEAVPLSIPNSETKITFYDVLNGLLKLPDVDIYVTGSNSQMLSKDIATNFRDRGFEIRLHPLSFAEYIEATGKDLLNGFEDYLTWGGMPLAVLEKEDDERSRYLKGLFDRVYIKDICERYDLRDDYVINRVVDALSSSIGSLTNPHKLSNTLQSVLKVKTNDHTINAYLEYLCDSFLYSRVVRYDVKGKRYFDTPCKYFAEDVGLRNARLNFRQTEEDHLMENVIYSELKRRGYDVDVGHLESFSRPHGTTIRSTHEIDFVVNRGYERIYIQSAWMIPDEEKMAQETFSLKHTGDSFKKVVIDGQLSATYRDNDGICHISLIDFLLNPHSLETL